LFELSLDQLEGDLVRELEAPDPGRAPNGSAYVMIFTGGEERAACTSYPLTGSPAAGGAQTVWRASYVTLPGRVNSSMRKTSFAS
jgi:hypothetical protein